MVGVLVAFMQAAEPTVAAIRFGTVPDNALQVDDEPGR